MSKLGAFLRRHRRAEEDVVIGAGMSLSRRLVGRFLGAGIAAAAIAAPAMIDLSNNNGPGAAVAISAAGVQAVEAKATEGLTFRDRDYPGFRAAAARAHRPFGAYLFLHPYLNGAAQADYFLAWAQPHPGDLQPVVDSEMGSPAAAAPATYAALHRLTLKGYRPLLYASTSYLAGLVAADHRLAAYRVWDAEYGPTLHRVAGTTVIAWQYTDRAAVAGHSLDGSRLLVPVASLMIPKAQARAKAHRAAQAKLRARTGFYAWLGWYLHEGDWKRWPYRSPATRPHAAKAVPSSWWRRERAFLRARV